MTQVDPITQNLPHGMSERDFAGAIDAFAGALASERVLTSEEDLREFRDPFAFSSLGRVHGVGGRHADDGRGGPGRRPDRQRAPGAALDARPGPQQRLRRPRPAGEGLGHRQPAPHEPRARDRRGARLRGRRARRPLVRPLRGHHRRAATGSCSRSPTSAGAASSATRSTTASRTSRTGRTSWRRAEWRSCSRTARSCAPAWARCPATSAWHVYKRGLGPTLDPLFMQSNFGIVTKMGIWLMPEPECYMPLWVRVWKEDDLGPLIDTLRELHARPRRSRACRRSTTRSSSPRS